MLKGNKGRAAAQKAGRQAARRDNSIGIAAKRQQWYIQVGATRNSKKFAR